MALIEGIPLYFGEGPGVGPIALIFFSVNISNDNKKNSNIIQLGPAIEIVGIDMTSTRTSQLALASTSLSPSRLRSAQVDFAQPKSAPHIAHR